MMVSNVIFEKKDVSLLRNKQMILAWHVMKQSMCAREACMDDGIYQTPF